ncbi:unnamed protein product [Peniophora sp. CBMAI 1063]|nr:unnamed protein product [Peniophora sp. CBMAI 1063]
MSRRFASRPTGPGLCPTLQLTGSCPSSACPYDHAVLKCDVCKVTFNTQELLDHHLQSRSHLNKVTGANGNFFCPICKKAVSGSKTWLQHLESGRHKDRATEQSRSPDVQPEEVPVPNDHRMCTACGYVVPIQRWSQHIRKQAHARRELFHSFKAVLDDAAKDRNGVTVSKPDGIDFGVVNPGEVPYADLVVKLEDPRARVRLDEVKVARSDGYGGSSPSSFSISTSDSLGTPLSYGREKRVTVSLRQSMIGHYDERLELIFEDITLKQRFFILRGLKAIVGDRAEYEDMLPKAPYVPRTRTHREPETDIVPGPAPEVSNAQRWVAPLPGAYIPKNLAAALRIGSPDKILGDLKRTFLPAVINPETYGRFWKVVIWTEENRMEHDLQFYDIENAELTPRTAHAIGATSDRHATLSSRTHTIYYLQVPGLAEKRPSVLKGDRIFVHPSGAPRGKWYEGHVHIVRQAEVGLRFHVSFPFQRSEGHSVRFKLNRTPLRRQHQALDVAFSAAQLLFPSEEDIIDVDNKVNRFRPFNPLISGNAPQLAAVKAIANLPGGSPPFIIFGPPGTGKTITLVEAILQFVTLFPNTHALICAPSNSAVDLIAQRLSTHLRPEQLFRYYAPSRSKDDVPTELLPYTLVDRDGNLGAPLVATLKRYRVIVCTCVSASFAHGLGIPRGHFDTIFVDEAGQATEPEVMIAVKTMADLQTNVVLAGDPRQLGPIIRSAVARKLGLAKSYLERLMSEELYNHHNWHGRTVVKLTNNYRSHEAILTYPNQHFYEGELVPCADARTRNSCLDSSVLVNKKFPVVFHAMSGKDDREASSPSFFNISEVQQIKQYVEALRSDRRLRISSKDIGIVAPYHAQCQKIKKILRALGAEDIKVGSTEEFQGQERRVMLISTVRSSREFVEYDIRHTLGFVANPSRFNVAITRAQALLIVVGDPNVLGLDPIWRGFLNYIHVNGGWKGLPIPWDPREAVREEGGYDQEVRQRGAADLNDLTARIQAMSFDAEEEGAAVERPWVEPE